jgi:hypothetical protein
MALYDYTRLQLRHDVAEALDDLITGTVASPASGSFICTETDWQRPDDFFNDFLEMYCYDGVGEGTSGKPTDFDGTTCTLTFKPVATLTAGDLVEMHERFNVARYNRVINLAIEMVALEALQNKVDTSITLVADTYQYNLPTDFVYINQIYLESSTSGLYDGQPLSRDYWRIVHGTTNKLEFVNYSPTADRHLRIHGLASPSILDTDAEECPVNPVFIVNQAASMLHQALMRGYTTSSRDTEWHEGQFKLRQAMADNVRNSPGFKVSTMFAVPVVEV